MEFANNVMNQFKLHKDAWMTVDKILELSQDPNTRFFALTILDEAVNVSANLDHSLVGNMWLIFDFCRLDGKS